MQTKVIIEAWIKRVKRVLKDSGVDVSRFSAHSTRGTSTSTAAAAGISTLEIMERAGWSNQSTFERFYHRPSQGVSRAASFGCPAV